MAFTHYSVLLTADEDCRPGDHQKGQCRHGNHNTPETGIAYCRLYIHGFSPVWL